MILTLMVASSITSFANAAIIFEKTGGDVFVCEAVLPSGEYVIGRSFILFNYSIFGSIKPIFEAAKVASERELMSSFR